MESEQQQTVAVLAEKPSVARDIAKVLGASKKGDGYLHGGGYVVTWAVGHLIRLAQPHEIRPEWKSWRRELLPMIPREWPLLVADQTRDQFEVVRKILNSPKIGKVICATDAGREGELIFRYIYEAAGCAKPVSRLWVSSLTPDAIRHGFETAKDWSAYHALADAARGRSRADWLVGMNLSRAYTLALGENFSVGRVQTPTLAMVVARELEIRAFVPEDYIEVIATFSPRPEESYKGTWFRDGVEPLQTAMRLPPDGEEAERIVDRARTGEARVESTRAETQRMAPPLLYDLTELQRHANRLFGFSAQKTLDLAQALYERHKLISYPRTDSRHLSAEVGKTLPRVVDAIREPYRELLAPGTGERPLGRRYIDDSKVTDHHAIIPTNTARNRSGLTPDETHIFDMICRRLLEAWHPDYVWSVATVITAITNGETVDRYHSSGSTVEQAGWKVLDLAPQKSKKNAEGGEEEKAETLPPGLAAGQPQTVLEVKPTRKKTRPPKRFTEATLLTAMETAGKTLDDKELSDAMKECGLGTPATRAAIIEVLLTREYIERKGRSLMATDKGIRLIEVVHPEVKSPLMTGRWEARLQQIHRGTAELTPFLEDIEEYVREVVGKTDRKAPPPRVVERPPAAPAERSGPVVREDAPLVEVLHQAFGFDSFRPNQEDVCAAAVRGEDVLLVMPTGSGKSLCYQLPGVARGGTTLVISPLVALMEDQVAKLCERGLRADRIHCGRNRAASRQACIDYLNGTLQFLFIAPERLRVTGFPEMLAKRRPSLIAIDEAHCISQWGHDFRPDYRKIGNFLPKLRPCPVIALTATATPLVQNDIVKQLGLPQVKRFIRGFRRDNIAIEVVEVAQSMRSQQVQEMLADAERRPAIVYTPTRREAEAVADALGGDFQAAAYHAGMDAERRNRVQAAFQENKLDVIVATIAFGMGVDKPNIRTVVHTALPGSIEAYYQEIGRAGRDGLPSRAILMQSYSDRHTHDYFFERDYPEPAVLEQIYSKLNGEPQSKDAVDRLARLDKETFETALEKLWIHGGAEIDFDENVARGNAGWKESYAAQREHKLAQLNEMLRFTECNECRMVSLVHHFGDQSSSETRCGLCDFCAPDESVAQRYRTATPFEQDLARKAVAALKTGSTSSGKLHAQVCGTDGTPRHEFERVLSGMVRASWIEMTSEVFEADGREVTYKRVSLSAAGRMLGAGAQLDFKLTEEVAALPRKRKKRSKSQPRKAGKPASAGRAERGGTAPGAAEEALRAWRREEARKRGVPAFRILSDRSLKEIAEQMPSTPGGLLGIHGIGIRVAEKYGPAILEILNEF